MKSWQDKLGIVVQVCNPSYWQKEAGGPQTQGLRRLRMSARWEEDCLVCTSITSCPVQNNTQSRTYWAGSSQLNRTGQAQALGSSPSTEEGGRERMKGGREGKKEGRRERETEERGSERSKQDSPPQ